MATSRIDTDKDRDLPSAAPPRPGLLRRLAERRSPRRVKTSVALRFLHDVLGLEHLHFGLWDGESQTLEGLRAAQDRHAEKILAWVPEGVRTVLDVGCGTGALAEALYRRGYDVEGLSPDPHQQSLFEARLPAPSHLVRLQEFEAPHPYDLVIMSESAQYIWLDRLMPAVRRAAPGGWLLVADYFRIDVDEISHSGHLLDEFRAEAERHGLVLDREEDVTEAAAVSLELGVKYVEEFVEPTVAILRDSVANRHPWLFAIGRRLARSRLHQLEKERALLDPEWFRRTRRYLFLRYRVPR